MHYSVLIPLHRINLNDPYWTSKSMETPMYEWLLRETQKRKPMVRKATQQLSPSPSMLATGCGPLLRGVQNSNSGAFTTVSLLALCCIQHETVPKSFDDDDVLLVGVLLYISVKQCQKA
jgi:hypothetical protein